MKIRLALLPSLILFLSSPVLANTVFLRSGQVLYGTVSNQDVDSITLITPQGPKRFRKAEISTILYQDVKDDETLKKVAKEIIRRGLDRMNDRSDLKFFDLNSMMEEARESIELDRGRALRMGGGWRSALLPGWGQFHKEQPVRGTIYASLALLSLANAKATDAAYHRAVNTANDPTLYLATYATMGSVGSQPINTVLAQPRHAEVDRTAKAANSALAMVGVIWAASAIDAFVFSPGGSGRPVSYLLAPGTVAVSVSF